MVRESAVRHVNICLILRSSITVSHAMAESSTSNDNATTPSSGRSLGFNWSFHDSLDPHLNVAAEAPRRLREDLHQVIRGLSPLVERSQTITLSTWLRHPRSHGRMSPPESATTTAHVSPLGTQNPVNHNEFVITMDSESPDGSGGSVLPPDRPLGGMSSPAANNNNGPSSADSQSSQPTDILRQNPELRALMSVAEKYLPFLLVLLAKLIFDHKTGILVLVGLIVTFLHSNAVIKREVGKQNKRNLGSLVAVAINLLTCVFFIYYVFESDKLYYSLICMMPNRETAKPLTFWDLLWIVGITDFVLKLVTILCKVVIVVLPAQVIPFQKKGKHYLFIEQTSQLYRSFTPIQPWLCYLFEAYEGASKVFGVVLCLAYIISKGKNIFKKIGLWRTSLSKLMQNVSYGTAPTKEQLGVGAMCPICQDDFRHPTMLQCKHIFCEECVVMWFDRERTCPMCRAQIADDPTWRDGATTFFFQLF